MCVYIWVSCDVTMKLFYHISNFICIMGTQVTKLKAQLEKMDRELARWRAGESVSTDEQVAIEMDASTTSQQLSESCVSWRAIAILLALIRDIFITFHLVFSNLSLVFLLC